MDLETETTTCKTPSNPKIIIFNSSIYFLFCCYNCSKNCNMRKGEKAEKAEKEKIMNMITIQK